VKATITPQESGSSQRERFAEAGTKYLDTSVLVRRAQAGDQAAFARLVEPHMGKTYHVALKITRNREDAEDASQQALMKAFANIGQFRGNSQFSTWLVRIAMNEALMLVRKRRSEDSHLAYDNDTPDGRAAIENVRAAEGAHPEVLYAAHEHREALWSAISRLRETLRVVVWMLGIEEHKSKDAARMLNLSRSAVKIRFSRARRQLRACLGDIV
jgi:RNA polymerase sigma-70 factor, ECF subfamily